MIKLWIEAMHDTYHMHHNQPLRQLGHTIHTDTRHCTIKLNTFLFNKKILLGWLKKQSVNNHGMHNTSTVNNTAQQNASGKLCIAVGPLFFSLLAYCTFHFQLQYSVTTWLLTEPAIWLTCIVHMYKVWSCQLKVHLANLDCMLLNWVKASPTQSTENGMSCYICLLYTSPSPRD